MHQDKIEYFKGNFIQHGKHNDRLYLMRFSPLQAESLPYDLIKFADKNEYSKILTKIPGHAAKCFHSAGFIEEALVPRFFHGKEPAAFMSLYLNPDRALENHIDEINKALKLALSRKTLRIQLNLSNQEKLKKCHREDLSAMTGIYQQIFKSYPFPIHDPEYILKTMEGHVQYFGIESKGGLVAVASAEVDKTSQTAELTDFATLPEFRGNHFSNILIHHMEKKLKKEMIKTTYTIARAISVGMNIAFQQSGYRYAGRLKNNTNISGNIESMNVWYKSLL